MDEEFEVAGEELERHLSLDPPEKLREAIAPIQQKLYETALASPSKSAMLFHQSSII